jgi:hypothetical protein
MAKLIPDTTSASSFVSWPKGNGNGSLTHLFRKNNREVESWHLDVHKQPICPFHFTLGKEVSRQSRNYEQVIISMI